MFGSRQTGLFLAISTIIAPAHLAAQEVEPEYAPSDSAAAAATDAFGERVGLNQVGLYSPVQTRGFDLMASTSAFRLNGFYFHPAAELSESLVQGSSINVGISAAALDLPSPTGVISYRLRDPGLHSSLSVTTGLREEGSAHLELLGTLVSDDQQWGILGHALIIPDNNRSSGEDGPTVHLGTVGKWMPGPDTQIRLFGSYSFSKHDGDLAVLAIGEGVPPALVPRRKYTPDWARTSSWSSNIGALLDHRWGRWSLGGSIIRSTSHATRSDVTILEADSDGNTFATLYHTPEVEKRSDSIEAKLARTFSLLGAEHRLGVGFRQRNTITGRAEAAAFPIGSFDLAETLPDVPAPDLPDDVARGRDRVQQRILSATYGLRAGEDLELRLGAHNNRYEKSVRDFSGETSRNVEGAWLYSASAVWRPTPSLQLFASYVGGLEETGTAPAAASNRGEVLPPVKARQYEIGGRIEINSSLSLILAGFDIRKPTYGLRSDGLYAPVGTVRHRGVEASLTGRVTPTTTVVLGANFMEPRVSGDQVDSELVQKVAPGVSRFNATISVEQQITPEWSLDSWFLHEGPRRRDSLSQTEVPAVPWLVLGTTYRLKVGRRDVMLRGQLINAIDREGYWATPYGPLVPVPPLTYRLLVSTSF
jgi:iron complex outermembrane receptor protein